MQNSKVTLLVVVFTVSVINQIFATIIKVPADYSTIQQAINEAVDGDEIIVAPGTYNEAINFIGKKLDLHSSGGRDVTTIDATGINTSVVTVFSGEGPRSMLTGFTITGGNTSVGGGMRVQASSPLVISCAFIDNYAKMGGGAIYHQDGAMIVEDCSFINNTALYSGGAINDISSNLVIVNSVFTENQAGQNGGAMIFAQSGPFIGNCEFTNNVSDVNGGAIYSEDSSLSLLDCKFKGNSTYWYGGGVYVESSNSQITGSEFNNNSAKLGGGLMCVSVDTRVKNCSFILNTSGGIYNWFSSPTITQCLFSLNIGNGISNDGNPVITNCSFTANTGSGMHNYTGAAPIATNSIFWNNGNYEISGVPAFVTFSDIMGGYTGTGNITLDPRFADPAAHDLTLRAGSPVIDAGDNRTSSEFTDLADNPRKVDDPGTPDTGIGSAPVIDMGCYEFQGDSTGFTPSLTITPHPLIAGQTGKFVAVSMLPNTATYLAVSLKGYGSTYVPPLFTEVDLNNPIQAGKMIISSINGKAEWILLVPKAVAGKNLWFQVCQLGVKTNVFATSAH